MTKLCISNSSDTTEQISDSLLQKGSQTTTSVSSKQKEHPVEEQPKFIPKVEKDVADKGNSELSFASRSTDDKKDHSIIYYAVSVPSESISSKKDGKRPLYFTNKQDALQEVKKYKNARFKTFYTEEEALAFALQAAEQLFSTPENDSQKSPSQEEHEKNLILAAEKSSPFKGPKSQDMVKLRKAIEAGDISYFRETVWSNPRYLISSGDTPAILQEGFRYNALHVAAKHKQPEICELLLEIIGDPKFMELLYNDDSPDIRLQRIEYVSDLYLNMPDKGLCETPLHFASKFGCLKAVQVLTSHPLCDKKRKNKYGLEPKEIICERCPSSSSELKKKIEEAFEDRYFVPVLRAEDNSIQPFVGKPYCQEEEEALIKEISDSSPCKIRLTVMAIAGPMSPKEAKLFYKFWKTPPSHFSRTRYQKLNKIRLSDTEKGLEILGRHLAHNFNAPWTEYWPSLNSWCDLSTKEGLDTLENHLRMLHCILKLKVAASPLTKSSVSPVAKSDASWASPSLREAPPQYSHSTPVEISPNSSASTSSSSGTSALCIGLEKLHLNDSTKANFVTSPDMPNILNTEKSCKETNGSSSMNESMLNSPNSKLRTDKVENLQPMDPVKTFETPRRTMLLKRSTLNSESLDETRNKSSVREILSDASLSKKKWFVTDYESSQSRSKLESCFQEDYEWVWKGNLPHSLTAPVKNIKESVLTVFLTIVSDSNPAVDAAMHMHLLLAEDVLPEIDFLLKSCKTSETDLSSLHSIMGYVIFKDFKKSVMDHELKLLIRNIESYLNANFPAIVSENDDSFSRGRARSPSSSDNKLKWQHLKCILKFVLHKSVKGNFILEQKACQCSWLRNTELRDKVNSLANELNFRLSSGDFADSRGSMSLDDSSSDECDSFVTPPGSPSEIILSSDGEEDENPVTPDEGFEVYIEGEHPSKADADVLRAIESVLIDPVLYPHVCRWKHLVSLKDRETVENWPSPVTGRFRGKSFFRNPGISTPSPPQMSLSSFPRSLSTNRCRSTRSHIIHQNIEARKLFDDFVACDDQN